jgi:hypothetical protein
MSQSCLICKQNTPNKFLCSSVCEQINFKLIEGKTGRKDDEQDPNQRDKKKEKEEDEDLEPFTQEPVSALPPQDVFRVQQNVYSLPDLYQWVINMGNTKIPLTGQIAGQDMIERLKEAANVNYPLTLTINIMPKGGMDMIPETRRYTTLATVDDLTFRALEITQGIVVNTIMEFMQSIVHLKKAFFTTDRNILQLVKDHGNKKLVDIQGSKNYLILFCRTLETQEDQVTQLLLCIEIAKARGKGYDMFQTLLDKIDGVDECVLKIVYDFNNRQNITKKYAITVYGGDYYETYNRAFAEKYKSRRAHDFWTTTIGIINGNATNAYSKGEFPYDKDDFDEEIEIFEEDDIVKVTITEEYWPPTITVEVYAENTFKERIDVDATLMADAIHLNNIESFSERFDISPWSDFDKNKEHDVIITMVWNKNKQIAFKRGTLPIFEQIFLKMEQLRSDFDKYAGPGINEHDTKWVIRVDINEQKTNILSCISCGISADKACGNLCGAMYCGNDCAQTHWDAGHHASCLKKK